MAAVRPSTAARKLSVGPAAADLDLVTSAAAARAAVVAGKGSKPSGVTGQEPSCRDVSCCADSSGDINGCSRSEVSVFRLHDS